VAGAADLLSVGIGRNQKVDIQTRFSSCLLITSLLCANSASADRRTYEIVVSGTSCTETSTQSIDCQYKVGKDLEFTIAGIGQPDTGVTFMKSSFEGDFYASFGLEHGCVIVKRGQELSGPDSAFDVAFVSPKNGKVYRRWEECLTLGPAVR
jgi:hypothetical protein